MISRRTRRFIDCFDRLPAHVQRQAVQAYRDFARNPSHPALKFKPTKNCPTVWSVRITLGYRALGVRTGNRIVWFWIGSHDDYMRLIGDL